MGKTARWFRSLFGAKKSSGAKASGGGSESRPANNNKKSSESGENIVKSFNENDGGSKESVDANKHAIAVAAATAAVAEAALAAAQAAAEVVRLTSGGSRYTYVSYGSDRRRQLAAVQIQSAFRAYLARRALKALKGLVKLQALVRGHIVRKQSTYMLQRMQAMARIQARACAHRAYMSDSSHSTSKSSQSHPDLASHRTFDHLFRAYDTKNNGSALMRSGSKSSMKDSAGPERMHVGSNWLDHWMEENSWNIHRETSLKSRQADDEKSDKILEVDTWKPHINVSQGDKAFQGSQHKNSVWNHNEQIFTPFDSLSRYSTKSHRPNPGPSPEEHFLNMSSLKHSQEIDQAAVWAAENSPGVCSVLSRPGSSRRRGTFSPTRSECSRNFFSSYMGHPNYMANTESSRAKDRSQSAPRQRMDFNKPAPTKRFVRGYWDEETSSERGWPLLGNFRTRGYPGSGHSANLGISVRGDVMGPTNGGR